MNLQSFFIVIVSMCLGAYIKSYVSKKASNLATKEDIAEITHKIESIKSDYALSLERMKSELHIKAAFQQAFQSKCFDAMIDINNFLIEITLYCRGKMAENHPNEHYVWGNVKKAKKNRHMHYYRAAIDKVIFTHDFYLTENAKSALQDLSDQVGMLSSMELALSSNDSDQLIKDSALSSYDDAIKSIKICKDRLINEFRR